MDKTAYYKKSTTILKVMDLFLTFAPLLGFVIYAFATGSVAQKVAFGMIGLCGVVLGVFSVLSKYSFKGAIYLILLGLHVAVGNIVAILIILAVTTLLDELLIVPLYKMYKEKYIINKELDERQN